jgi:hypothetical protein
MNAPQITPQIAKDESGQAVTEYILLLAAIVGFYVILANFINSYGLGSKLMVPITGNFAHAYQYGKVNALGFEDGGPSNHPRIHSAGNFRIFINPAGGGAEGGADTGDQ